MRRWVLKEHKMCAYRICSASWTGYVAVYQQFRCSTKQFGSSVEKHVRSSGKMSERISDVASAVEIEPSDNEKGHQQCCCSGRLYVATKNRIYFRLPPAPFFVKGLELGEKLSFARPKLERRLGYRSVEGFSFSTKTVSPLEAPVRSVWFRGVQLMALVR